MDKVIFTKDHKSIIKQLREARILSGLNQKQVAKKLGKTQSYLSKIESGQRRVDIIQLKEFARLYKKNIQFFLKND
jgi:transcriptional regulator with XRE-family HTH domain